MATLLFRDDPYLKVCEARVTAAADDGVMLDATVFYPTGGGQPGDSGRLVRANGSAVRVQEARKGDGADEVFHVLEAGERPLVPGEQVTAEIDWERRLRLMRTHSCLHLLCKAVDGAVTGGSVGELKGRLDFDIPEASLDKETITAAINAWVSQDLPITASWIEDEEFDRRPDLVRTMSVTPPRGQGRVRLVRIEGVDLQACGGTHVARTGEIGTVRVTKIEKKGRQNRRVVIEIDP